MVVKHSIGPLWKLRVGVPSDCLRWMKSEGNARHAGCQYTIVDFYDDCDTAVKGWEDHKDAQNPKLTFQSCPSSGPLRYDKLYEKFIYSKFVKEFVAALWAQ